MRIQHQFQINELEYTHVHDELKKAYIQSHINTAWKNLIDLTKSRIKFNQQYDNPFTYMLDFLIIPVNDYNQFKTKLRDILKPILDEQSFQFIGKLLTQLEKAGEENELSSDNSAIQGSSTAS